TQVDQSLTFLKNKGYISDDNSNDYLKGQFLALIEALYSDYTSQRGRAGMWDQLCLKAGLTGDSNAITVDQLYQAIQSQVPQSSDSVKLSKIKEITYRVWGKLNSVATKNLHDQKYIFEKE